MNLRISLWELFGLLMIITAVVCVFVAVIENLIYRTRSSEYINYNGKFSGILKSGEKPFTEKKKRVTLFLTVPIIMLWVMTDAVAVIWVMENFYVTNLWIPLLLLFFTFPALIIVIGIIIAIILCITLIIVTGKLGLKRTLLRIRKKYKIED